MNINTSYNYDRVVPDWPNSKCKRVEERLQDSHLIKARWIHENTVEVPPSLEHQKVLLTIVKRLETIWGVAIPNQINKHIQ